MNKALKAKYDSLSSLAEAVMFAIDNNDHQGVSYAFKTKPIDELFIQYAPVLLFSAYRTDNVQIAKMLIDHNLEFDITNLLYVHVNVENITAYTEHLDNISAKISNTNYEQGISIIQALSSPAILNFKELFCFNKTQVLLSRSFNNNLNHNNNLVKAYTELEKLSLSSTIIDQTLTTVAIDIIQSKSILPLLVVPNTKNAARIASYNPGEERKIVYMPFYKYDAHEQSIFMHELDHYAIDVLFKNSLLPYLNIEQQNDYHSAITKIIGNIIQTTHSPYSAESIKAKIKLDADNIYNIKGCIYSETMLPIFLYPLFSSDKDYIEDVYKLYNLDKNKATKGPTLQDMQDYIELSYNKLCTKYQLSDSNKHIIARVTAAILRPGHGVEEELIIVATESEVFGEANVQYLAPMIEYREKHIRPMVVQARSEIQVPDCDDMILGKHSDDTPDL